MDTAIWDGVEMPKAQKGSQYERDTCKQLSLWWTQDLNKPRDDVFWRCSQSGGRATTRAKRGIKTAYSYGDVTFIDPIGKPFIDSCLLELKRGYTKGIDVLDFLDKKKGIPLLVKWWDKATEERHLAGRKYTTIIFRRDRHKACVMISQKMYNAIELWFGSTTQNRIQIKTTHFDLAIVDFESFLQWCNPHFFQKEN